jgi:hypothetical protein
VQGKKTATANLYISVSQPAQPEIPSWAECGAAAKSVYGCTVIGCACSEERVRNAAVVSSVLHQDVDRDSSAGGAAEAA